MCYLFNPHNSCLCSACITVFISKSYNQEGVGLRQTQVLTQQPLGHPVPQFCQCVHNYFQTSIQSFFPSASIDCTPTMNQELCWDLEFSKHLYMAFALEEVSLSTEVNDSSRPPRSLTLRFSGSSLQTRTKALRKSQGKKRKKLRAGGVGGAGGVGEAASLQSRRKVSVLAQESPGPHPAHLGLVSLELPQALPGPISSQKGRRRSCGYLTSEQMSFVPHQRFWGAHQRDQSQNWGAPQGLGR